MSEISPLFAVEAEQMLLAGFVGDAINLCEAGLKEYPDYSSALAVLARAYAYKGNSIKSDEIINDAKQNSYSKVLDNISLDAISVSEVEEIILDGSTVDQNITNPAFEEELISYDANNDNQVLETPALSYENSHVDIEIPDDMIHQNTIELPKQFGLDNLNFQIEETNSISDDNFAPLKCVVELISIRQSKNNNTKNSFKVSTPKIVTETMADLLIRQGNKIEAKKILLQLIEQNPTKKAQYSSRINKLVL